MFYKIFLTNWDEIKIISKKSFHFNFRGHTARDWELKPTLERAADKFLMDYYNLYGHEYLILREFKSVAKQYLNHIPEPKNFIEWMALLQHFGAPTRLLDFTYSIYIAAFFAFESATSDSAIWAVNRYQLDDLLLQKMENDPDWEMRNLVLHDYTIDVANKLFDHENKRIVETVQKKLLDNKNIIFTVKPDNRNIRQSIQKGVFLMPSTVNKSFQDILIEQFNFEFDSLSEENAETISFEELINDKLNYKTCLFKLIIPRQVCVDGLYDLRNMNINAATLFPGLDGQARSLNLIMRNMEDISLRSKEKQK